jgi:hypothetical protein
LAGRTLPRVSPSSHSFPEKPRIRIADAAFQNVLSLFARYSWNLNDTPGGKDDEINPDVLGYIFEKYINQKEFGAYYTRPEMTGYLSECTIFKLVLDRVQALLEARGLPQSRRHFASISDLLLNLDATLCHMLLFEVLPSLHLLDPACGSAAFLVAAMKVLINLYSAVIGRIRFLNNAELAAWLDKIEAGHPSPLYYIKKRIITENLFGVDIMDEATEIARLRLFLALVASAQTEDQLEPLPNIDFNILTGNSLISLLHVDPAKYDAGQAKSGGTQEGPADSVMKAVMQTFCPRDEPLISPMIDKGKLLEGAPAEVRKLLAGGCSRVFVLWDWHPLEDRWTGRVSPRWRPGVCRVEAHELRGKLNTADLASGRVVLICVAQELEAWALADHQAIARVIARRRRRPAEPVRKTRKPEQCPDPEQTLENIFRGFDVELAKYTDVPAIIGQAQTNRFKRLRTCPSFVRLVEKLTGKSFEEVIEAPD